MDSAPYNPPTYFAPSYFYAPSAHLAAPAGLKPYNPPTYFAPSYFYGAATAPVSPPVAPAPKGRDGEAYASLVSVLRATGAFAGVAFGDVIQRGQTGAEGYPQAVVTPRAWEESDDFDPVLILRRVSFTITVVVKAQDAGFPFDALDQLGSAIQGVVDRSDLGGTSLGALTKIRSGRYGQAAHYPEQSLELDGSFSMLIDPLANPAGTA